MKMKYLPLLLLSFAVLSACDAEMEDGSEETDRTEEETTDQASVLIPRDFTLNKLSIEADSEDLTVRYVNNEWIGTGVENPHTPSISRFVDELYELTGTPSEREPQEDAELTLTLSNNEDSLELDLYPSESFIEKDGNYFEVAEWPQSLSPFDPIFLEEPLTFELEGLEEVVIEKGVQVFTLNQETTMNEVERMPFVSGWYVHGDFETAFSAEYYWMEDLLTNLYTLRGYPTEETLEESGQRIRLKDGESQESVTIGQEVDDQFTLIHLSDQNYRVPSQLLDIFDVELFTMVDNFVALIPLDTVQTVGIMTNEETIHLSVDRTAEAGKVVHTFYVNDKEIDEDVFRRTYQYLARLAYSERIEERDNADIQEEDSDVTIHYTYLLDGEEVEKTVSFVPEESSSDYFVINDGIVEFKMTDERLNDMLEAFLNL
ncbi:hypothetical protein GCM10008932_03420 [Alkalibacterium iburiense]|uniref:DUF4340 domain-containing protein n=1 Tax=Alkalibacterium iburiense TaxID=290589 RepID=A0ABN0X2U1_9LACT